MLHGSETWPARKENEVALQRAEMRMVRWMCGNKVKERFPSSELRGRLGIDYITLIHTHTHPSNGPLSGTTQVSR